MKAILKILGLCVLAAAGYTAYQWFATSTSESAPAIDTNRQIIPLKIPPNRADSATAPTAGTASEAR